MDGLQWFGRLLLLSTGRALGRDRLLSRRRLSIVIGLLTTALLASCGGGGSGSDGPALTFTPATLTGNFVAGTSATLTVQASVADSASGANFIYVVDADHILAGGVSVSQIDASHFAATLHTSTSLTTGRHQGTLQIQLCKDAGCAAQVTGSPVALPYDLTVTPAPLQASATTTTTATVHQGGALTSVDVSVVAIGFGWSATSSTPWLQVPAGVTTGSGTLVVGYSVSSLVVGNYSGKVTVTSTDGQTVDIAFTLTVLPTQFVLNAGVPSFTAVNGAVIAPQTLGFALDSAVPATWSATTSATWLNAAPLSGTTPAVLSLQPDPTKGPLAAGAYTADIVLASPGIANKTVTTTLALSKATLSAPAMSVTLGGPTGRDLVSAQSLLLSLNTGTNTWPLTLTGAPSWLSASLASGQVGQAGVRANFAPVAANVAAGSVSSTVTAMATVNGDSVTLPVTANLNADQRRLIASQWGVGFASSPTGSVLTRSLHISDNFDGTLAWTATSDQPWLTVTGSGTTAGASTIALTAAATSLPVGTTSFANVTVATATAGVSPAVIKVAIWKSATGLAATIKLPLTYTRLIADRTRPYVYAHNGGTSIDVYNVYTASKVMTMSGLAGALGAMSLSQDGTVLYALDTTARVLVVVDVATGTKIATWSLVNGVDARTELLAIRPNGVDVVLVGDGTAYQGARALGSTGISGSMAASADGRKVYTQDSGFSPASVSAFNVDYSAISGGVLMVNRFASAGFINGASNGADIAVDTTASNLYVASGAPYLCSSVDPVTLAFVGSLPGGDAYPNNVEVTSDGRAICGISGSYATADFWVHSSAGALLSNFKVAGYAKTLRTGQMVVSPDGLVVVALTDDPLIAFVPIGP